MRSAPYPLVFPSRPMPDNLAESVSRPPTSTPFQPSGNPQAPPDRLLTPMRCRMATVSEAEQRTDVQKVVVGGEKHQQEYHRQAETEPVLLRPVGQRPTARGLNGIEQKVSTIEKRDREQVEQADRHRDQRH